MTADLLTTIEVTLRIAGLATCVAVAPAVFVAYLLARKDFAGKVLIETLILIPLVLPPSAVGYLLLRLFAYGGPLGPDRLGFDPQIVLTERGAIVAAAVMSFPLIVRAARITFSEIDPALEWTARCLGLSRLQTLRTITLPLARRGLVAALALGFARAVGEFGATLILAGSIQGETRTLALAIYSAQETGRTDQAWLLLAIALLLALGSVLLAERLARTSPGAKRSTRGAPA